MKRTTDSSLHSRAGAVPARLSGHQLNLAMKKLLIVSIVAGSSLLFAGTPTVFAQELDEPSFHEISGHQFDAALALNRARAGLTNFAGNRIILLDQNQLGLDARTGLVNPTNGPVLLPRSAGPLRDVTVITLLPSFRGIRRQGGWPDEVRLNSVMFTNRIDYIVSTNRLPPLYYRDYVPVGEVLIERRGGPPINVRQMTTTGQP